MAVLDDWHRAVRDVAAQLVRAVPHRVRVAATAVASSSGSAPARRRARAKVLTPRRVERARFSAKCSAPPDDRHDIGHHYADGDDRVHERYN